MAKKVAGVGEEEIKKVIKRPKRSEQLQVQTESGENAKYLQQGLEIYNLPEIDTNNLEQVQKRIAEYFEICTRNDMKPSVAGLALAFNVNRKTLWSWVTNQTHKPVEIGNAIKKAYKLMELQMESYMQNGKINPVAGIFLMKNNYGYADKSEVVVTPNQPMGAEMDQTQLEQKYEDDVVFEVVEDSNQV